LLCFACPAEQIHEPWLNLSRVAAHLRISPETLRLTAECGEIDALHPLAKGLGSSAALFSTALRHRPFLPRPEPSKTPHVSSSSSSLGRPLKLSMKAFWIGSPGSM
jgi:hypothetical protein